MTWKPFSEHISVFLLKDNTQKVTSSLKICLWLMLIQNWLLFRSCFIILFHWWNCQSFRQKNDKITIIATTRTTLGKIQKYVNLELEESLVWNYVILYARYSSEMTPPYPPPFSLENTPVTLQGDLNKLLTFI